MQMGDVSLLMETIIGPFISSEPASLPAPSQSAEQKGGAGENYRLDHPWESNRETLCRCAEKAGTLRDALGSVNEELGDSIVLPLIIY